MPSPTTEAAPILLVQLSDSHLFADADGSLLGMNTHESLRRVIEQVLAEQERVDLVLATGDLSQDGTDASYQQFRRMTAAIKAPARWLAGNHDEPLPMERVAAGTDLLDAVTDIGNWRVLMLNSSIPGSVPGHLDTSQLQLLEQALADAGERHCLVCLHHQPVSIDCAWMAPIGLRNPDALFQRLESFPQVRALLWGHIHQEWDQQRGDLRLLASPSTCVQFEPGSDDFKVDEQRPPGYRWLALHDDGRLETGVSRLKDFAFTVDYGNGY